MIFLDHYLHNFTLNLAFIFYYYLIYVIIILLYLLYKYIVLYTILLL